jgi:hypothetical protein
MQQNLSPNLSNFDPCAVKYQAKVLNDINFRYDYSHGTHEVLLSGSVGSAKSILMAHIAILHCINNARACILLGRRAMPDVRDTIYKEIVNHLEGALIEGHHYTKQDNICRINFSNGSQILTRTWADKRYKKMRSLALSMAIIEELTENDGDDRQAFEEIKMRLNRIPWIKQNLLLCATNPDSPEHWAYKYFEMPTPKSITKHVYYSKTTDNPFLPPSYVAQLRRDLDPKMAKRMIDGEWIEIRGDFIYYAYEKSKNFINKSYVVNKKLPIHLTFDFNIGEGKPMSCALMQFSWPTVHVFNQSVIMGVRTADIIEDLDNRGLLLKECKYIINGDAAGKHKDTRSSRSDYDIIRHELSKRGITFEYHVAPSNPPVRTRHNRTNGMFLNSEGERRLFIYKDAPTADEGFRLTKLKQGANYIEDDSKPYQHITTAIGYAIIMETAMRDYKPKSTVL